jgi:hypothetical protein
VVTRIMADVCTLRTDKEYCRDVRDVGAIIAQRGQRNINMLPIDFVMMTEENQRSYQKIAYGN